MKESLLRRIFQYVFGGLLAVAALLVVPGVIAPLLLFVIRLLFGWTIHAARALSSIVPTWRGLAAGAAIVVATLIALHLLLRIFACQFPGGPPKWQWRWSASVMGMLLILFATTCASVGLVHHAVWLLKSEVIKSPHGRDVTLIKASGHSLALALRAYAQEHGGQYPSALHHLVTAHYLEPDVFGKLLHIRTPGEVPQTWTYLPRPPSTSSTDLPLLLSPFPASGKAHIMVDLDAKVTEVDATGYEAALNRWRTLHAGQP